MLYDPKTPKSFMKDEKGEFTLYTLILALVVIVTIVVLIFLGADIADVIVDAF